MFLKTISYVICKYLYKSKKLLIKKGKKQKLFISILYRLARDMVREEKEAHRIAILLSNQIEGHVGIDYTSKPIPPLSAKLFILCSLFHANSGLVF